MYSLIISIGVIFLVFTPSVICGVILERFMTKRKGEDKPMQEWIVIKFNNGDTAKYSPDEYTDYYYDKKCFVVIKDKKWIGIYNLDAIEYAEIRQVKADEFEM